MGFSRQEYSSGFPWPSPGLGTLLVILTPTWVSSPSLGQPPPLSCSLTPGPNDLVFYVISSLAPEVGSWGWHVIQVETSQLCLRIFQSDAAAIHTLPQFCLLPSETVSLQPPVPPLKKQRQDSDGEETGRQLWWCWSLWIQSFHRPALSCPCASYDLAMWVNRLSVFLGKNRDFCLMPPKPSD